MLHSAISFQIGFCIFLLGLHFQNTDGMSINNFNGTNCGITSFKCDSGECIPEENICDGTVDCQDESDEKDDCRTNFVCNSLFSFQCNYGGCIDKVKKCDGNRDCRDNSDETLPECQSTSQNSANNCGIIKFQCDDGQCIEDSELCDGVANCIDGSDESRKICSFLVCPPSTYRCNYGACVNRNGRCNNVRDCFDGSDEAACPGALTRLDQLEH